MELNPIVTREVLSRWRGFRSFGLLFAYSAVLAAIMGIIYASGSEYESAARRGHDLFLALTISQIFGWMLLAPALTAGSIAGERERGLLEAVQLSHLSPARIAWGKLLSALILIGLMLFVPLPVIAICFFTGGVSPGEFGAAFTLYSVTALTSATIGLVCSAWSRRPHGAMLSAFSLLMVWGFSSAIAIPIASEGKRGAFTNVPQEFWVFSWWDLSKTSQWWNLLEVYGVTNPVWIGAMFTEDMFSGPGGTPPLAWLGWDMPLWIVNVMLQGLAVLALFWLSVRALHKPFVEQSWVEIGPQSKKKRKRQVAPHSTPPPTATETTAVSQESPAPSRTARWELPLASVMRFSNPILQHEMRSKFRIRRWSRLSIVLSIIATVLLGPWVLYLYILALNAALFERSGHDTQWWIYSFIALMTVVCISSLQSAGAFTREIEKGTRESLLLSLLSSREIIIGKLMSTLLSCGVWIIPLLPLMIPNINHLNFAPPTPPEEYASDNYKGVSWILASCTLLLLGATAWCYTILGMLISWLCRRTAAATLWTIGSLIGLNMFVPLFWDVLIPYRYDSSFYKLSQTVLLSWHPFIAMSQLAESNRENTINSGFVSPFILFLVGCLILTILRRLMRNGPREQDESKRTLWLTKL